MPMMILPIPAASATAEPDIPEKISEAMTLTWPSPPRKRPTMAIQKFSNRSEIVPAFMILAATINSGTLSSTKLLKMPWMIFSPASARSMPATPR